LVARGEFSLQFRKVRSAFVDDHHLPADDSLTRNIERSGND
jgi:hypothetical protein